MSLRAKLLTSYVGILAIVVMIVFTAHGMANRWRRAAETVSRTHTQSLLSERLRWDIMRLIDEGLEWETGDRKAPAQMKETQERIRILLHDLRQGAEQAHDPALVMDHITGFEEAYNELLWINQQMAERVDTDTTDASIRRWNNRLTEIGDEVNDAATAMEQYFHRRNAQDLREAERVGERALILTGLAAAVVAVVFVVMIFALRRWVTRPMAELGRAADDIGRGNLRVVLPDRPEEEWRKVNDAVHHMTRSLSLLQHQVRTTERLSAIGEVAAYTAHNIRNPLASIRAIAQVSMSDAGAGPETREGLEDIIRCADKMEEWIARLLGYARPLTLEPEPCDISQVAREAATVSEGAADSKGVHLHCLPGEGIPSIRGDRLLLEQALSVILSNAIEATPKDGHVRISTGYEADTEEDEWVVVRVADTGAGIPEDVLPTVFKPFVSGKKEGSGLGLAVAKKIVDLHLGEIHITSRVDEGTTITIRLPVTDFEGSYGTGSDH